MYTKLASRLTGRLLAFIAYIRALESLKQLSDREMQDIGINRSEVNHYADRAAWMEYYHAQHV
jgi:uncharacterized protein YjiS (DUF1127 family)